MATPQPAMLQVLLDSLPRDGRWRPLDRLYRLVQDGIDLDAGEMEAARRGASPPRWKRNLQNVLQYRRQTGEVEWDGDASYRFPSTPTDDIASADAVEVERARRLEAWRAIDAAGGPSEVRPLSYGTSASTAEHRASGSTKIGP